MQLSVLSSWPKLIVQVLEQQGINADPLLIQAGISRSSFEDPNARIPSLNVVRLWQLGAKQCNDDLILSLAQSVNAGTFHALGFAMATSQTGLDALRRLEQYYPILTTSIHIALIERDNLVGIRLSSSELLKTLRDQFSEVGLAEAISQLREASALGLLGLCRSFFGYNFTAQRLFLKRDLGKQYPIYQTYIGCELQDKADFDEVWFKRGDLEKPLPSANVQLASLNDQIVKSYISILKKDVSAAVASEIVKCLPSGGVTQAQVASALNMSSRTLQRKLAQQDQSFRSLLSDTRRELAIQYVRHENIPILEVGFRLGFSEPANFTRAFKQWTGLPPKSYRKKFASEVNPK